MSKDVANVRRLRELIIAISTRIATGAMSRSSRKAVQHPIAKRIRALLNHQENRGVRFKFEEVAAAIKARLPDVISAIRWLEQSGYVVVVKQTVWWPLSVKQTMTSIDRPDYHCGPLADGCSRSGEMGGVWMRLAHPKL